MDNKSKQKDAILFSKKYYILLFFLAILIRAIFMFALDSLDFFDQWSYGWEIGKIAKELAIGKGFSIANAPTAKYPPVYPLIVGGVFAVFGVYSSLSAITLFFLQSIFSAITAVCLTVIGSRLFGREEGLFAGLIWAFYPTSILYSIKFIWYSELTLMIVMIYIIIILSYKSYEKIFRIALLGALSGFLILVDSTMSIYPMVILFWMMYIKKYTFKRWILNLAIWIIALGILTSPWAIRNKYVMGNAEIVKSNFGLALFNGNNSYSTEGGIDSERQKAYLGEFNRGKKSIKESEYKYLQKKAIEWIKENPLQFIKLSLKRFIIFWGKFSSNGPGPWKRYTWIQLIWYTPLVILALYGSWFCVRKRLKWAPIWIFFIIYPLPYYITHVQLYRYRYPVEPFLVLLAAIPLAVFYRIHWKRQK